MKQLSERNKEIRARQALARESAKGKLIWRSCYYWTNPLDGKTILVRDQGTYVRGMIA